MSAIILLAIGFFAVLSLINFMIHEQSGDSQDALGNSDSFEGNKAKSIFNQDDQDFMDDNFGSSKIGPDLNDPFDITNPMNRFNPCSPYYDNSTDLTDPTNPLNSENTCSTCYDNTLDLVDPTNMSNYTNLASPLCDESFKESVTGTGIFDDISSSSSLFGNDLGSSSLFDDTTAGSSLFDNDIGGSSMFNDSFGSSNSFDNHF